MNLVEYKNVALQRLNKTIANNRKESMSYSCMGLIEETGEIIAELRKPLFKGNFHEKALDIPNIKSELGDLFWYIALMSRDYNIDIAELEKIEVTENELQLPKREEITYHMLIGKDLYFKELAVYLNLSCLMNGAVMLKISFIIAYIVLVMFVFYIYLNMV